MPFSSFPHLRKTARREVASDSYPELAEILVDRPPPNSHQASGVDGLCALCNSEPATQEISGTTVGERCAEHLMGVPGGGTPYPEFGQSVYGSAHTAAKTKDADLHFHFIATWADVRAKAARIRREGGVRIINAPDAKNPYIVAEVQGDHHTYQSTILRTMGRKSVAGWECTCAWAHYAWGRSGRWKKFEGRMCSHALATTFQAQADEMFGGRVKEIEKRPAYMDAPYFYKAPPQRDWRIGSKQASFFQGRPIAVEAEARLEAGEHPNVVLGYLRAMGAPWPEYILTEALQHPDVDWHSGLEPDSQLQMKSAKVVEDPAPHLNKDGTPHSGVMVALVPPRKVREDLAVEGGESPEDMHVTVGYLGNKDGIDADALHRAVGSFAKKAPPLGGKISGFGNFEVDPERNDGFSHCHVGLVDIPGIAGFREKLAEHLGREGLHIDDEHGIQPHLTVAYGHEPMEYGSMPDTTSRFDLPHVTVSHGSKWTHYPLEGSKPASKEGMLHWARDLSLIHPGNAPEGTANLRATHFSDLPQEHRDQLRSHVEANSPDKANPLTEDRLVENIKGHFHDAMQAHTDDPDNVSHPVEEGKKWYPEAHRMTKSWGKKYGINHENMVGSMAALSPRCDWGHNVEGAHYLARHLGSKTNESFNVPHEQAWINEGGERKDLSHLVGKRFHDMTDDEAANSLVAKSRHEDLKSRLSDPTVKGEQPKTTWTPGPNILKAVKIARGASPHETLGGHKVRSFNNNIADPTNHYGNDDVTMDSHAVSAAADHKYGSSAADYKKILDSSGKGAADRERNHNVHGTYSYFAHAYRRAHAELRQDGHIGHDVTPSDLQAIIWNQWRGRTKRQRATKAAMLRWAVFGVPDSSGSTGPEPIEPIPPIDPWADPDDEEPDPDLYPDENEEWHRRHDSQSGPRTSMLHWSGVQDSAISEDVDPSTDDEMDQASTVQKAYNDQANQAQDDWYFNQPRDQQSPFPDNPSGIPTYMSAMPSLGSMKRWGAEAAEETLHEEPEGALPSTDGGAPSELWDQEHSTTAQDPISAGPAGFGSPLDPGYQHEDLGYPDADEAVLRPSGGPGAGSFMNDLENKFTSIDATGSLDPGAESRAWLLSGESLRNAGGDQGIRDSDIAAMARRFLDTGEIPEGSGPQTKVAAKVFTPAEQQELIQEGADGTRASNLDRLMLEGTHYQADEDDLEGLFDA